MQDGTKATQSTVAYQNSARTFTQKLYPSDIKYNFVEGRQDADKFKVYVVYRISVTNNTTHNLPDLYKEKALQLTSLTETFDSYRYELNKDNIDDNDRASEIAKWNSNGNIATYKIDGSGKKFETGLYKGETESTYIQFKVTDQFLGDIAHLSQEEKDKIYENSPCFAKANGYHIYTRNDKNWKDNKQYDHRTIDYDRTSGALGIIWQLADTRTISGTVFEDSKIDERANERIGNGTKDDAENTISDVIVSLMDANSSEDNPRIAKAYTGKLEEKEGIWSATVKDAIVKANENGEYTIPDVVPGRYYLKFIYGNGETKYKDLNNTISIGTKIKGHDNSINTSQYKSTIMTGEVVNANSSNEKTWFLDEIDKNDSIASDVDITINNITKEIKSRFDENNKNVELNYIYSTNNNNAVISANSPNMDVHFEYIPEDEINSNLLNDPNVANPLRTNCTGMSFGIIERPHVNITLKKTIKNIRLTLQNGTTIINGNPNGETALPNVARINESNSKLELDPAYIYGSNAIVTYTLSAHNESELDYASEKYYKYGINTDDSGNPLEPIETKVTKIVDYINNQNASYDNQSENVIFYRGEKTDYFSEEVINANKNYKQEIFMPDVGLLPECYDRERSSTEEYEFTVNNLLSNSDGILGWESYSEIIGISNITLTPQYECRSGSYIVGNKDTQEADTANATISIYTSTGENKNLIIYYILGASLIIVACGVILIKKFVIKNK